MERRSLVREGRVADAVRAPWWPEPEVPGTGLYRPLSLASLAVQGRLFAGHPAGFHSVSLLLHAAVTVGLFGLLLVFLPTVPAGAGAALFAVHPVHVEAVATVTGQAGLLAALLALACVGAYLACGRMAPGPRRAAGWIGVGALYLGALLSKEGAVAIPGLLALAGAAEARGPPDAAWGRAASARRDRGAVRRLLDEAPLFGLLAAVLVAYLALRLHVLGSVRGEVVAPSLRGLGPGERIWAALGLWPDYLRLFLLPVELSADYSPGVRFPATGPDPGAVAGGALLLALLLAAGAGFRRRPASGLGAGWIVVAILPVSHFLFPTGVLLAERTLYLASAGLSFVVGDAVRVSTLLSPRLRRVLVAGGGALLLLLGIRTAVRSPVWESSASVVASLEKEHPSSVVVIRDRARRAVEVGRLGEADSLYVAALSLVPRHYGLLVEAAQVSAVRGEWPEAGARFDRAVAIHPRAPAAYLRVARQLLAAGRPADAREVALQGIARAEPVGQLWRVVARSWEAQGRPEAAARARAAARAGR